MSSNIVSIKNERRLKLRRVCKDRRTVVRFGDALGRRSGLDRRRGSRVFKHFKDSLKVLLRGNV